MSAVESSPVGLPSGVLPLINLSELSDPGRSPAVATAGGPPNSSPGFSDVSIAR